LNNQKNSFSMESNVFNRTDTTGKLISENVYNLTIGLVLAWGFLLNWLLVTSISPASLLSFGFWPLMIGYFVSCFIGIRIYTKSDDPFISFIGYNFVVIPFGLILNIIVSSYDPVIVQDAIRVTGIVTCIMMILGSAFPSFFQKISGALTVALIAVIIVEMVEIFIFKTHHGVLDWIVALIFCGYIGYDWGRANRIPKTLDNAVDSAASLYMDIINLFIRILRIMGKR